MKTVRHPSRLIDEAGDWTEYGVRQIKRSPLRLGGGLLLGGLALFAFIWFLPEGLRYLKIERM